MKKPLSEATQWKSGHELHPDDQEHVKRSYLHRFTMTHTPGWAKKPRPDGTKYMPHFKDDSDWLHHTKFAVKSNGRLHQGVRHSESTPTWPLGQNEHESKNEEFMNEAHTHFVDTRLKVNAGMNFPTCHAGAKLLDTDKSRLKTTTNHSEVTCPKCKKKMGIKEEVMNENKLPEEPMTLFADAAQDKDAVNFQQTLDTRLAAKISDALEVRKADIADSFLEEQPTRKHFRQVASVISQIADPVKRKELADHHAHVFAAQNPRFNHQIWHKACGTDGSANT